VMMSCLFQLWTFHKRQSHYTMSLKLVVNPLLRLKTCKTLFINILSIWKMYKSIRKKWEFKWQQHKPMSKSLHLNYKL
jgi:hypothetical protein